MGPLPPKLNVSGVGICEDTALGHSFGEKMAPLKQGFIILSTILQHVLYVYNPPNVIETNGLFNEGDRWVRFNQTYLYNDELAAVSWLNVSEIQRNTTTTTTTSIGLLRYKLKFTFSDNTTGETVWMEQFLAPVYYDFGASNVLMYMSSGFILANFLYALVYCLVKCKCRIRDVMDLEMYSIFTRK